MYLSKTYLFLLSFFFVNIFAQVGGTADYQYDVKDKDYAIIQSKKKKLQELKNDPDLYKTGKTKIYKGEYLEAIDFHIGSIGGGAIRFNGKGEMHRWQIFNNLTELSLPNSFFAVSSKEKNNKAIVKTLNTAGEGPFKKMDSLVFTGEFPFANYYFKDKDLPLDVRMEVYSPFVPLDIKNSVLPVVIFNFTITNTSDKKQTVSLLQSQQNAVGYSPVHDYSKGSWNKEFIFENDTVALKQKNFPITNVYHFNYRKNFNESVTAKNRMISFLKTKISKQDKHYGEMAVLLSGEGKLTSKSSWQSLKKLYEDFQDGQLTESDRSGQGLVSKKGETYNTALAIQFELKPGESKKVTAIISWYFPNGLSGGLNNKKWWIKGWGVGKPNRRKWGGKGNYYENYWNNIEKVIDYAYENLEQNEQNTRLFHRSVYQTTLPHWAKDRLTSQLAILNSKTIFWTKDNYFGGWEGTGPGDGSCAGNCAHVWHYAQGHARLFPTIGRRMTEQGYYYQKRNGMVPYRHPDGSYAGDSQFASILQGYRDHLLQKNNDWLTTNFCKINRAMKFAIDKWDKDKDGRLSGSQHTTLDCDISGNSSWLGSMYAAALLASSKMAKVIGEESLVKEYSTLAKKAIESHEKELWNGEYFIQKPSKTRPLNDYATGSAIDQLLGQWWASQVNIGNLYPKEKIAKAMSSVFKYNFFADFKEVRQVPREFVKDFQAGMRMITWPRGNRPKRHTTYSYEVMSGFEYAAIAAMLGAGLKKESFVALKAIYDRYNGKLYSGHKGAWGNWGFSGNPFGDDECGKMYSRSLSVWSILLAYQGFEYNAPEKKIAFYPSLEEKQHRSFFSAAEGWGVFEQNRKDSFQENKIKLVYGNLDVKKISVKVPQQKKVKSVLNQKNNKKLNFKQVGEKVEISFENKEIQKQENLSLKIFY